MKHVHSQGVSIAAKTYISDYNIPGVGKSDHRIKTNPFTGFIALYNGACVEWVHHAVKIRETLYTAIHYIEQ
jgi:hypothetical protein